MTNLQHHKLDEDDKYYTKKNTIHLISFRLYKTESCKVDAPFWVCTNNPDAIYLLFLKTLLKSIMKKIQSITTKLIKILNDVVCPFFIII